jgi:hypothetical protein
MKTYRIWHATGENRFMPVADQPREFVGTVEAESLDDAFRMSQNFVLHWNLENPCRSTSVGDVIEDETGFHMVCGMGFQTLSDMSQNESEQTVLENQSLEQ